MCSYRHAWTAVQTHCPGGGQLLEPSAVGKVMGLPGGCGSPIVGDVLATGLGCVPSPNPAACPPRGQQGQPVRQHQGTASVHVSRILAKLGVTGRGEATAIAHRLSLDKR
jgi:hypothetical protein